MKKHKGFKSLQLYTVKCFSEHGRQNVARVVEGILNLIGDWTNCLSVTFKQTKQISSSVRLPIGAKGDHSKLKHVVHRELASVLLFVF